MKLFGFPWFGRKGIFIYPVTLPGLVITMSAVAWLVYSFIDIDSRSHSASDTLRPFLIRAAILYVICFIIALVTELPAKKN